LKDELLKLPVARGRPDDPALTATENVLAALIGIRIAIAVLSARSGMKLTAEDRAELARILDLANDVQDEHLRLRAIVSEHYQRGR
jgi:hypothetical protein